MGLDIDDGRLVPLPGASGWLARAEGAVLWVPELSGPSRQLVQRCMAAERPGRFVADLVSGLADPAPAPWPPFGAVIARPGELVVVVHGPVELEVDYGRSHVVLRGGDETGSWASRPLKGVSLVRTGPAPGTSADGPASQAAGTGDAGRAEDDELSNLARGVVKAAGFTLAPRGAAAGTASPAPQPTSGQERPLAARHDVPPDPVAAAPVRATARPVAVAVPAQDATVVDGLPSRETTGDETMMDGVAAGAGPTVTGVYCPGGHFNDPRRRTCPHCGSSLAGAGRKVEGPRPPLGVLTWDDGQVTALGDGALVGRDATADERVVVGLLLAVAPRGTNDSMSRVHAELAAAGWDVTVMDRGSTNGTFLWDEGAKTWQRLVPGEAQLIAPGAVLAFGERTATFDS